MAIAGHANMSTTQGHTDMRPSFIRAALQEESFNLSNADVKTNRTILEKINLFIT
jgi:hypothetical protein